MTTSQDDLKEKAAREAVYFIKHGMRLGLGTGTTAAHVVRLLGEKIERQGMTIHATCTSDQTRKLAASHGIRDNPLTSDAPVDLYIDGADEIDTAGNMIKGGGAALLREKLVAEHSSERVIVVDNSKIVERLGAAFPLPVEIVPFGKDTTLQRIADIPGVFPTLRVRDGEPVRTDSGNFVADCQIDENTILNRELANRIKLLTGVIETGFFDGLCDLLIVASPEGIRFRSFTPTGERLEHLRPSSDVFRVQRRGGHS